MYYHSYFKLINGRGQYLLPYKFNGKELDRMHGLNWYDHGARMSDPALGRWHVVDPLCEKYYDVSPYVMCHNDPINRFDPDGKDDYLLSPKGLIYMSRETTDDFDKLVSGDNFISFSNRKTLPALAKTIGSLKEGYSEVIFKTDRIALKVFSFLANNTNVEWGLDKYSNEYGSKIVLRTNHNEVSVEFHSTKSYAKGLEYSLHSHPGNSPRQASGYNTQFKGNDMSTAIDIYNAKFEDTGKLDYKKEPFLGIYHPLSNSLVRYN